MAVIPIVEAPNKILNEKTKKVRGFEGETLKIIKDLKDTLDKARDPEGAGLSSNQIGVQKSICVVRNFFTDPLDETKNLFDERILINPKIVSKDSEEKEGWEGCLSVPNTYGKVLRSKKIKVRYQDMIGQKQSFVAKDFFARVIQHELDHLNGILFTSKVTGDTVTEDFFNE